MEEAKELQLSIKDHQESNETNINGHTIDTTTANQPPRPKKPRTLTWWIRIGVYSLFLLAGQAVATLLGRLYFNKGGNSKWLATLVQLAGFPILLPYYLTIFTSRGKKKTNTIATTTASKKPYSKTAIYSIYIVLGLIIAFDCYLYSVGLMYIPVSTYSLICASQLAFNAFFSYFLNKQKFTPYIINSLVLLTISSVLLVFNSDSDSGDDDGGSRKVSRGKYAIGFICTVAASAGYGLVLSLTQFFISNVLRRDDFRVIMDVTFWQSVVASLATVVGLFASGEWARLGREMEGFKMGKVSYVMNLAWTAVTWQLFSVGNNGLIVEVSSLFSNVIGVLGLPIVPVFAMFFLGEKMNGLKAVAMVLAVWGFVSYAYQNYLDGQVITNTSEEDGKKNERDTNDRERDE